MDPNSLQRQVNIVSACVLPLLLHDDNGLTRRSITVDNLVVAGWTGRDRAAVEHHIKELAAIGVKAPAASGSAPGPIIPTAKSKSTVSRYRSRCATSRSRRNSGRWSTSRRIGT